MHKLATYLLTHKLATQSFMHKLRSCNLRPSCIPHAHAQSGNVEITRKYFPRKSKYGFQCVRFSGQLAAQPPHSIWHWTCWSHILSWMTTNLLMFAVLTNACVKLEVPTPWNLTDVSETIVTATCTFRHHLYWHVLHVGIPALMRGASLTRCVGIFPYGNNCGSFSRDRDFGSYWCTRCVGSGTQLSWVMCTTRPDGIKSWAPRANIWAASQSKCALTAYQRTTGKPAVPWNPCNQIFWAWRLGYVIELITCSSTCWFLHT